MSLEISDHALLRYLARSAGMPVETLRVALAKSLERSALAACALGAKNYNITHEGLIYLVRNGVVVTVMANER